MPMRREPTVGRIFAKFAGFPRDSPHFYSSTEKLILRRSLPPSPPFFFSRNDSVVSVTRTWRVMQIGGHCGQRTRERDRWKQSALRRIKAK